MKIMISQTKNTASFGSIVIAEQKTCKKILKGLNVSQLNALKKDLLEQQKNPVNALVYNDLFGLKAKIFCRYRLKDFVECYSQIPLFESNEKFLKRIINQCNEYKKQLKI